MQKQNVRKKSQSNETSVQMRRLARNSEDQGEKILKQPQAICDVFLHIEYRLCDVAKTLHQVKITNYAMVGKHPNNFLFFLMGRL